MSLPTTFRIIDLETTGFDPRRDRVVEIASVDLLPDGSLRDPRSHLVNPGRTIPPVASAIHHITAPMVADAPPLKAVLPEYQSDDVVYVAHNAAFDAPFLPALQQSPWLCTYRLARHVLSDAPGYGNQVLRYWLELEQLPEWTAGLMAHRALYDVATTALLLRTMLGRLKEQGELPGTVDELLAMSRRPVREKRLRFGKYRGKPYEQVPTDYLEWMKLTDSWGEDVAYTVEYHLRQREG